MAFIQKTLNKNKRLFKKELLITFEVVIFFANTNLQLFYIILHQYIKQIKMKRILLVVSLAMATQLGFAQKQKVNSAWNYLKYEEYDKAKAAIDEAEANEDSKGLWKTWYYKGLIYQTIHEKKLEQQLNAGDALMAAYEAYKKSLEIDPKHDYAEEALKNLQVVNYEFGLQADEYYKKDSFSKSLDYIKNQIALFGLLKT
ncbi:MAG: hypothetical protein RI955_709, partial [Bacteroidota bacterium]